MSTMKPCAKCRKLIYAGVAHTCPDSACYYHVPLSNPAPSSAHPSQPAQAVDVDSLAQEIRRVDGMHMLGAGALAEALMPFITRAISGEKAGRAGEWESAFHAQRPAAMRAHTICYETMLAHPEVAELGDDGRLHDAIHDILRVDGPASPAPDKENL